MSLKEYLLNILQLEVSKQNQDKAIAEAEASLRTVSPQLPKEPQKPDSLNKPEMKHGKTHAPKPPSGNDFVMVFLKFLLVLGVSAFAIWMFVLVKRLFDTFGQGEWNMFYVLGLCIGTIGSVVLDIYLIKNLFEDISILRHDKRTYHTRVQEYEKKQKFLEAEYNAEMAKYEQETANRERSYKQAMQRYQQLRESTAQAITVNKQTANNAIAQMKKERSATEVLLKQYYDVGVVHPKYQTIPALTAICEYLDTGRCTALTGPNGAYNIYEAEQRQDLILSKLDTVIAKLEKIEQNQVLMLKQLQNIRNSSDSMSKDVKALLSSNHRIEKLSCLTAYCSAVTAVNTAATLYYTSQIANNTEQLKYIALVQ